VGTSGFSFEDWTGVFYPPHLKKSDWFLWYIRHFPALEVNSTYYRIPAERTFQRWNALSPERYPFVVKTHAEVTHKREDPAVSLNQLLRAVAPLRASGKLDGLLAQFPYSFRRSNKNLSYLSRIRSLVPAEIPLFAEFRHDSWEHPETPAWLEKEGIAFCCVDEPDLRGLLSPVARATAEIGYVRFHGRNAEAWWGGEGKGDRYDYLYSDEELEEWVERIRELDRLTDRTYVFFNNCYAGQAVRGAKRLQALLGIPATGEEIQTLDL